jgi:transposase
VERGAEAGDRRAGFCSGRIGLRGCPRLDVVPGQIYRWRRDLRRAAVGFAEVVVAPEPSERTVAAPAALEIELGRDIRVRIATTAPKELASAIIKALAAR